MKKKLSIIIPVYNEEKRLDIAFDEINKYIKYNEYFDLEFIFVDDGSKDKTSSIISSFIKERTEKFKLISYPKNMGKGCAVRSGMLSAGGDYMLIADVDMSTSLFEIKKFIPFIVNKTPIVIGVRKGRNSFLVKRQPWYREKMGEVYAFLARLITGVNVKDFGCGFKFFSKEATYSIFSKAIINRWTFDTEVLFLAKKFDYKIEEVGVIWENDMDTRVNIVSDIFVSLFELLKIRLGHFYE